MSIDSKITVSGWVGTQPRHVVTQNGTSFTVFRLGSTKRYFDRSQESWVDGATTWFTVKTWRSAAVNVAESLRRSDPVVVHGALSTEVWESPDGPRTTLVIEADALGPDLTRGQATFRHTVHHTGTEAGASGGGDPSGAGGGGGLATRARGGARVDGGPADDLVRPLPTGSPGEPGGPELHALVTPAEEDPWLLSLTGGPDGAPDPETAETVPPMSA